MRSYRKCRRRRSRPHGRGRNYDASDVIQSAGGRPVQPDRCQHCVESTPDRVDSPPDCVDSSPQCDDRSHCVDSSYCVESTLALRADSAARTRQRLRRRRLRPQLLLQQRQQLRQLLLLQPCLSVQSPGAAVPSATDSHRLHFRFVITITIIDVSEFQYFSQSKD